MTAEYVLESGERFEARVRLTLKGERALSVAYFCPRCGQIWARCFNGTEYWRALYRTCESCPQDGEPTRGSLLLPWEEDPFEGQHAPFIAREFLLEHTRNLEKEYECKSVP